MVFPLLIRKLNHRTHHADPRQLFRIIAKAEELAGHCDADQVPNNTDAVLYAHQRLVTTFVRVRSSWLIVRRTVQMILSMCDTCDLIDQTILPTSASRIKSATSNYMKLQIV